MNSEWLDRRPPNPVSVDSGYDLEARYGELTPLRTRFENAYPGVTVAANYAVPVSAAPVALPRSSSAVSALVQVQSAAIRWTVDGTAPAAGTGVRADPGALLWVTGPQDLLAFQAVREGAVDANLAVVFYA